MPDNDRSAASRTTHPAVLAAAAGLGEDLAEHAARLLHDTALSLEQAVALAQDAITTAGTADAVDAADEGGRPGTGHHGPDAGHDAGHDAGSGLGRDAEHGHGLDEADAIAAAVSAGARAVSATGPSGTASEAAAMPPAMTTSKTTSRTTSGTDEEDAG